MDVRSYKLLCLIIALSLCEELDRKRQVVQREVGTVRQTTSGKCENRRGLLEVDDCYCDDLCIGNDDCCDDYRTFCVYPESTDELRMITFDGRVYTFQGLCWFTLFKDCSSPEPDFEVSAKFQRREDGTKTGIVSFNLTVGHEHVTVDKLDVITNSFNNVSELAIVLACNE
ncbi:uncharacterized protein LOC100374934 [Saccoglossus kowalevskii]